MRTNSASRPGRSAGVVWSRASEVKTTSKYPSAYGSRSVGPPIAICAARHSGVDQLMRVNTGNIDQVAKMSARPAAPLQHTARRMMDDMVEHHHFSEVVVRVPYLAALVLGCPFGARASPVLVARRRFSGADGRAEQRAQQCRTGK